MDVSPPPATNPRVGCCADMRTKTALVVALLCALAGAISGPARAEWDDRPEPGEFESELAPHGYWVDEARFGRAWRPNVEWDWRPYSAGQWIWTSYGWTWSSYEPWSWTFHYGRWGWSSLYGWVWSPGYVWGPAWVDWFWGDGYVGWVPLGPAGFAIVPSYWSYVNVYDFCAPRVNTVFVHQRRLPDYIVHHRDHRWGRNRSPEYRDIEVASRHRIDRETDRRRDSIAPWVHRRAERGERVRERVFDGRSERVVEHGGGTMARRDRDPRGVDDGGWRRDARPRDEGSTRGGGRQAGRPEVEVIVPDRGRERPDVMRRERNRDDRNGGAGAQTGRHDGSSWGRQSGGWRQQERDAPGARPPMIIDGRGGGHDRQAERPRTRQVDPGWSCGAPRIQPGVPQGMAPTAPPSAFGGASPGGGSIMQHGGGRGGGGGTGGASPGHP